MVFLRVVEVTAPRSVFPIRAALSPAIVVLASLFLIVSVDAAPTKKHRTVKSQWKGYGFLPGYAPAEAAQRRKSKGRLPVHARRSGNGYGASPYTYTNPPLSYYSYGGYGRFYHLGNYYYGAPGFLRGQYNGGSFGPCWTQTPIGPIWNCGR